MPNCPNCNEDIDKVSCRRVSIEWCDYNGEGYDNFEVALSGPEEKEEFFCPECDYLLALTTNKIDDWFTGGVVPDKIIHPLNTTKS